VACWTQVVVTADVEVLFDLGFEGKLIKAVALRNFRIADDAFPFHAVPPVGSLYGGPVLPGVAWASLVR
jgi:hypothetical protein